MYNKKEIMKTKILTHMSRGNIMAHAGFSPEGCTTSCVSGCNPPERRSRQNEALSYQFDELIYRMVDKYKWPESKARSVFKETKQFLVNAAVTRVPLAPTKDVDEVWHNFILYTIEYAEFCTKYFGKFIHHVPKKRSERMDANCQSGNCGPLSCISPPG